MTIQSLTVVTDNERYRGTLKYDDLCREGERLSRGTMGILVTRNQNPRKRLLTQFGLHVIHCKECKKDFKKKLFKEHPVGMLFS